LHAVGDLVDGNPQPEILRGQREAVLDLYEVRADEVDQAVVVGWEEHVELAEHTATHVPEDRAGLDAQGLATDRPVRSLAMDPFGERLHHALQAGDVLPDPVAAPHHPRARPKAADGEVGELPDVPLGAG